MVLSAYNGGRHIAQQIDSIIGQSFRDWKLLVRDDGSSDNTREIVQTFAAKDPRISLVSDVKGNLGPWASFGELFAIALELGAAYVFVADQDDVWLPGKMDEQLSIMRTSEELSGTAQPLLVHSDPQVVDENLQPIHPSFREFQRTSYDTRDPLRTLLIHNAVVGCTMAMNRALLRVALPIPPRAWHDWWIALCAAATGTIRCTPTPTVLYRQHARNVIGAGSPPRRSFVQSIVTHPLAFAGGALREFANGVEQAQNLRDRMQLVGADTVRLKRVESYCTAFASGPLAGRMRSYRDSGARPRRMASRFIMLGFVAVFPAINGTTE